MIAPQDAQVEIVLNPEVNKVLLSPGPIPFLNRGQILEATESCLAESGYDGTTIRAIAHRLDCSVGSIYRYFQDKRELLLACGERLLGPAVEAASRADASFTESVRAYASAAQGNPQLYKLMFWLMCGRGLPSVVHKVIALWSEALSDVPAAEQQWTRVHGMLTLGYDAGVIVELVARDAMPAPARTSLPVEPAVFEDMTLL